MSDNVIQPSFAAGELSPSLFARVDFAKYHSGAARMRNFFVDYRSGASTRPGTEFIRPTLQGQGPVRLIRFEQSVDVTYVLEFSNHLLRFLTEGGSVVTASVGISNITTGTSTVVTAPGTDVVPGSLVFLSQTIAGLSDRYYLVQSVGAGGNVVILDPFNGAAVDSSTISSGPHGGTLSRVYEIATPYSSDELFMLKYSQRASIMNLTHPNHPLFKLILTDAVHWTLVQATFGSTIGPPTVATGAAANPGPANYMYKLTTIDANGQESQPYNGIHVDGAQDMRVIDSTLNTSGSISLSWDPIPGAFAYNVYRSDPNIDSAVAELTAVGFVGTTTGTTFVDANIASDFQTQPPIHQDPFTGILFPQVSSYFQQRLTLANGGGNEVDHFWMGRPGQDYNFDISNPSQADDAVDAKLVSLEVNSIKSLIPMPTGLIMLTTKGAWLVSGGSGGVASQGGPISPASITATAQAYIGANDVPPILVNYDIMYVQQKGSIVRDLTYNIYSNIYTGNDISILSSHLFYGHQIVEWAYAEEPFKVIWAIREDGILLSLTLVKEQDMYGWARHDTQGYFRSVATVTEGTVDATYFVVERPYPQGGPFATVQQIERLHERSFPFGAEDAWCVDAGAATVPFTPDAAISVLLDDAGNAAFQTDAPAFGGEMIGWVLRVGGGKILVNNIPNNTTGLGTVIQTIQDMLHDDPLGRVALAEPGAWSIDPPVTQMFGLNHLEGAQVAVLADGGVVNGMTITNGTLTLPQPASRIVVGLPFQAQLQTMYLDLGQEANTIQGKRKKVAALTVRVKDSRGLKAGRTFQYLVPIKELNRTTVMGQASPLVTADERIIMDPLWDVPGQICLQIDDPLPATVLGVIPEVVIGDTQK